MPEYLKESPNEKLARKIIVAVVAVVIACGIPACLYLQFIR